MINIISCNIAAFMEQIKNKDVYCFGCGKYFNKFVTRYPNCKIKGIIDSFRQEEYISINTENIPLYNLEEFKTLDYSQAIILIAVQFFEDIVYQLDSIDVLDGINCYLAVDLLDYDGIGEEIKYILKKQVHSLANRKNVEFELYNNISAKKYQLWNFLSESNIGGSKARTDIRDILAEKGYKVLRIHSGSSDPQKQSVIEREWECTLNFVEEESYVLIQHPVPGEGIIPKDIYIRMKQEKKVRFIIVIHEVESLRKVYNSKMREEEFEVMLSIGDIFIVHNDVMRQFFIEQGIAEERVYSLQVFDYIDTNGNVQKIYEKSVTIAANLDSKKSPYIHKLGQIPSLRIYLYGPGYDDSVNKFYTNIEYKGSYPTEIIPQKMDRGFGLIWDGEDVETCSGGTGEYLRYNNPHKLSLYLSAGLPVIIWSEAAEAKFVLEHQVGFCVDSLCDITEKLDHMDIGEYYNYVYNAEQISSKLKEGYFIKAAIEYAEKFFHH